MRPIVGLADLVRLRGALLHEAWCEAAPGLGYTAPVARSPGAAHSVEALLAQGGATGDAKSVAQALQDMERARALEEPAAFWRVESFTPREAAAATSGELALRQLAPDEMGEGAKLFVAHPVVPIAPWRRLWPVLWEALSRVGEGRGIDVARLVRLQARGESLGRVPRVMRRVWADRASLWIDVRARMVPVFPDQEIVLRGLRRVFRRALELRHLDRAAHARAQGPRGWLEGHHPDDARPVLVLGDLGALGDGSTRTWSRSFRALRAAGVRATALVPCATSRIVGMRAGHVCAWQRGRASTSLVERLLTMASAACFVEPGLLRALRLLLARDGATLDTELAAWNHPDVEAHDGAGLVLKSTAALAHRDAFRSLDPAMQAEVRARVRAWHASMPKEFVHAEALVWRQIAHPSLTEHAEEEASRAFACALAATATSMDDDHVARRRILRYARAVLSAMPVSAYKDVPALAAVWEVAHEGLDGVAPPEGVDVLALRSARGGRGAATQWALRQVGDALVASPRSSARWPSDATGEGSPVAVLETLGAGMLLTQGAVTTQRRLAADVTCALTGATTLTLDGTQGSLHLAAAPREPWASEMGRDRYGLWARVDVGAESFRMRWIPPGRFMMGSPEGEAGREDNETLHEVVLTRGYWLGETPVTQGLWEVVMGANPSYFKSADRPVEQVSWEDCAAFMRELNKRVRGLGVWFPTEAEWERACRGGTATATWEGDLAILGTCNAPLLDELAWYGGNSGVEFELSNGVDSSSWPEKQYAHERAGTRVVGQKRANPFGLCDMLGNVWEWCADTTNDWRLVPYSSSRGTDPLELSHGTLRVLRGASWNSFAGGVRAAQRGAFDPRVRDFYVGLRLARGQAALKEGEAQAKRVKGTPGGRRGGADARRRGAGGSKKGG